MMRHFQRRCHQATTAFVSSRALSGPRNVRAPNPHDQLIASENRAYVESLLELYREDKSQVDPSWYPILDNIANAPKGDAVVKMFSRPTDFSTGPGKERFDYLRLAYMIETFERFGHLRAVTDPLGERSGAVTRTPASSLDLSAFGFSEADRSLVFNVSTKVDPKKDAIVSNGDSAMTLGEIYDYLTEIFCGPIGFEFMSSESAEVRNWFREQILSTKVESASPDTKKKNFEDVVRACGFEKFLQIKYATQQRFGLDGGEAFIPAMNAALAAANDGGATSAIIGMAHRGRLNTLANILQKPLTALLNEFEGRVPVRDALISGDVKYHLGLHQTVSLRNGKKMDLDLVNNPSHLEVVNPLVLGKARGIQVMKNDEDGVQVMPILIHGDAAYAGQGSCFETTAFHDIKNFSVGGTLHVVINNCIGFTANPRESRPSAYSTDLALINNNPVLHVNGDDVDACVRAAVIAARFRQKFHRDVYLDIICYRRNGHNEADLPDFTQPTIYEAIRKHPRLVDIYTKQLVSEGIITSEQAAEQDKNWEKTLRGAFETMSKDTTYIKMKPQFDVKTGEMTVPGLKVPPTPPPLPAVQTGVKMDILKTVGKHITTIPSSVNKPHPIVKRTYDGRNAAIESGEGVEWGLAELLAFGTLSLQKVHVRVTGEDVERGTFTQRHAVLTDQTNDKKAFPLGSLSESQSKITISNSMLSEFAAAGFEMGYNLANAKSLVMWEAQFGDFANGAQVIFDQYLGCYEEKWNDECGLVLSLPHGFSGQGPEHSSARVERYLQLSDDIDHVPKDFRSLPNDQILENRIRQHNWQVTYPSTPASYFHILRRQGLRSFSKPLVNFFSKARLRAPNLSPLSKLAEGSAFQPVIDTAKGDVKARKVIFCSGQVESIVADGREALQKTTPGAGADVVLITVEQLAPFPWEQVADVMEKYHSRNKNVEFCWLQEEPRNMGMWAFVRPRFMDLLKHLKFSQQIQVISRRAVASPSTGYASIHAAEEKKLITECLA